MGKASIRMGFLALMESFPLQTTTTSREKIFKVTQDQNSQTMNSNNIEFATYSVFTPFLCPLWAQVPIPVSELYTANDMSQANESSQPHTLIPSLSRPICSTDLLSQLEMPKLPRAIHSLTPRKRTEFKVGNPWTTAQALRISREKGFGYFPFHSKKIYGWSSYNKCWVRVINLCKPTSH